MVGGPETQECQMTPLLEQETRTVVDKNVVGLDIQRRNCRLPSSDPRGTSTIGMREQLDSHQVWAIKQALAKQNMFQCSNTCAHRFPHCFHVCLCLYQVPVFDMFFFASPSPQNPWLIFLKNRTNLLPKPAARFCLLEQGQSFPKTYFLLLLQFGISTHSPKG